MPSVVKNKVEVVGASELLAAIETIKSSVVAKAARRGLYAAVVVFRDEVRRRAPVRTGALKKSIIAYTRRRKVSGTSQLEFVGGVGVAKKAFTVSPTGKAKLSKKAKGDRAYQKGEIYARNYAHLVEFGTKPHYITKGSSGPVAPKASAGGTPIRKPHPGAKPKPFFRPAFDSKKAEAAAAFKQRVLESIETDSKAAAEKAGTKRK